MIETFLMMCFAFDRLVVYSVYIYKYTNLFCSVLESIQEEQDFDHVHIKNIETELEDLNYEDYEDYDQYEERIFLEKLRKNERMLQSQSSP